MDYITPQNRQQITFSSLEDKIKADNPVHFWEAFVDSPRLEKLSFDDRESKMQ